jgi:flagellum-specific ATP synthase
MNNMADWDRWYADCRAQAASARPFLATGRLTRAAGLVLEVVGLKLPLGAACLVEPPGGDPIEAEVVGFAAERVFVMPTSDVHGLMPGAVVRPQDATVRLPSPRRSGPRANDNERGKRLPAGSAVLGRVLDAAGRPLDGGGPIASGVTCPLVGRAINPIDRSPIREPLDVGVRAINALLTVGRGQRMGLFAGSGVGKSVLLGMMARYCRAEVIVVGLIGERGREVKEFVDDILGPEGLARAVVVAAPADTSPLMRLQGAAYAASLAEHFRDEGRHVLLIMDSLTRYAMAQREIALAIGEPPATKGYPPSAFARLPQLVERAGNAENGRGSVTAFYTVLVEGDDLQDPIADSARAILDGHIVLSRRLADQGHYPAIDIEASVSRVMGAIATPQAVTTSRRFRSLSSRYQRAADLIAVGAYQRGGDPLLDEAVQRHDAMQSFLAQDARERAAFDQSLAALAVTIGATAETAGAA